MTPHHSIFYRPDALSDTHTTVSKHWRLWVLECTWIKSQLKHFCSSLPMYGHRETDWWLFCDVPSVAWCRVVSMLDSGAEGSGFNVQLWHCFRQTVHTHRASVHREAKLVAALLRVAGVTAGLAESNGSLPLGLWLISAAGWLPRTGISSGTLCSAVEYGLALPLRRSVSRGRTAVCVCVCACVRVVCVCLTAVERVNSQLASCDAGRLFAVVHAAGKQRKVTVEDIIVLDKQLAADVGQRIHLNKVATTAAALRQLPHCCDWWKNWHRRNDASSNLQWIGCRKSVSEPKMCFQEPKVWQLRFTAELCPHPLGEFQCSLRPSTRNQGRAPTSKGKEETGEEREGGEKLRGRGVNCLVFI